MPATITFQHYEVLVRDDGAPWELGRGAMGVTYKALDTNLRVPVALKVIHPRQLDSELVAQRFVREARAAARLRHPHIAAVYHLGQEGENWFYAMEFVDGDTAEALVKREGPLPEPTVLTLAIQAARALNAAAALGLVHRDIKPSNLMLTRDGDEWQLKVIDFGLARTFKGDESDEDLAAVTHSGFVGTPYYASPEQLEQHELDIRSDIYSLGVTLWFLLTGRVPFTGSVVSVLSQHLHKAPPFEQLDGVVTAGTRQILERMLAKDPAARPQSALDLRHELEHCEEDLPGTQARAERKAAATPPPPSVAETAATMIAPADLAPEVRFTAGESHFDAADTVAEFGFGQLCRARERSTGADFAILRLGAQRELDDSSLAHLQETIGRARAIEHEQVWKVHALESDADGLRIVLAWSEGYPWRELLRRRRELEPADAFPLLAQAACGIDVILAAKIDQPDVTLAGLWCEAPTPDAPPTNVKVSPLGVLRTLSNDATWGGDGTLAGGAGSPVTGVSGAIRSLAEVAYETLGGSTAAPGFPPLPALSETANKVLRTALRDPAQFPTASALIEQIIRGQNDSAPFATVRRPAASSEVRLRAAEADEPIPTPIWNEAPPPSVAAESEAGVGGASPEAFATPPSDGANDPAEPATSESEIEPEVKVPAKLGDQHGDWQPPSRSRGGGFVAVASVVLLVAGAAWFIFHDRGEGPQKAPGLEVAQATPVPAPPTPKPTTATPPRTILVMPATPLPAAPPPTPSQKELALKRSEHAAELFKKQLWEDAARELLSFARDFPEYRAKADLDLELLFREIRWQYTPRTDRPTQITKAQVEALVDEAEAAADLGVPGAMMLLGQHYTNTDRRKAIGWYEKASPSTPKANTRIGLVLTEQQDPTAADLAEAWKRFQQAEQGADLDGRIAVAENLLFGTLQDGRGKSHPVPGLVQDERRGVQILREVIGEASRRNPSASSDGLPRPEAAGKPGPDTGESQPNRAKVVLASYLLQQEKLAPGKRPAWYREEADTMDHGGQLRTLLAEASADRAEALALLADAYSSGIGGAVDSVQARKFAQEGADRGDGQSMYLLANYLGNKRDFRGMPPQARQLMISAAKKREPKAIQVVIAAAEAGDAEAVAFCKDAKLPFGRKVAP